MTKSVGSMTRGQGNEICNQIENACKAHNVNPEEIATTLIRENFFEGKIKEYLLSQSEQIPKSFIPILSLTSEGHTGDRFLADLKKAELSVGAHAEQILKSKEFAALVTNGVTYYPGVIKGEDFSGSERTSENIRKEATKRGGITPPVELSPLLRLNFSDDEIKALGLLWLIPMHEPINGSGGNPYVLGLSACGFNDQLSAYYDRPANEWDRKAGFVFLFPQVNTEVSGS